MFSETVRASLVFEAICGVSITFGRRANTECRSSGSLSKTSSAAPAIVSLARASASALLFTNCPRAVFTNNAVGFIRENSAEPNIERVCGVSRAWTEMASALANSSEKLTSVLFELSSIDVASLDSLSELINIRIPIPSAIRANRIPTAPVPTIPSVLPANWVSCPPGHSPSLTLRSSCGIFLAKDINKAKACSATATVAALGVFVTTTPRRRVDSNAMWSAAVPQIAMCLSCGVTDSRIVLVTFVVVRATINVCAPDILSMSVDGLFGRSVNDLTSTFGMRRNLAIAAESAKIAGSSSGTTTRNTPSVASDFKGPTSNCSIRCRTNYYSEHIGDHQKLPVNNEHEIVTMLRLLSTLIRMTRQRP